MSSYTAGTLELDVLGINDSTAISIERTAKALNSLNRVLKDMKGVSYGAQANKIVNMFNKLAIATNSINTQNIANLATVTKSLGSISRLQNVDWDKVAKGFNNMTIAITPFVHKVKEAEVSLIALYGILQKSSGRKIQGLLGGNGKTPRPRGNILGFGVSVYAMRRLARFGASLVQSGSAYYETLNLWQVAMRGNNDLADEFVTKMNKAYGISTKTLMNAQAIFRNMLGSLGQIPDDAAYKISEALVQMSADFSSLYNVKIEQAFSKMQSMLAGQVRPIRSAGLDMTETTLFMFYQQLGGTKTMRQLNRTEKQLLSILAVYRQMGRAGALGDMAKTLNQFANQTRMMTEYWTELKSWTGLVLKDLIEQSGVMVTLNASLIVMTEVIKAIAKSKGLGEENFIDGMFETTEATNDEIDELQGKLLDFDKFRALEDSQSSPLAIDEKLLEAIAGYSTMIDKAQNEAQKLAETWLKWWINDDGGLTIQATIFLEVLKAIGATLLVLTGASMIASIKTLSTTLGIAKATTGLLVAGFGVLLYGVLSFISAWDDMSGVQRAIGILGALAGAITAVAVAFHATHNWGKSIAIGALVAGSALAVTSAIKIPNYETGASDIDSGTVFRAGEFGKTEAVYTGSNGKTNVANVRQMEQAFYNALSRHTAEGNDKIVVQAYLDGEKVYENTTARAKARGKVWAKA